MSKIEYWNLDHTCYLSDRRLVELGWSYDAATGFWHHPVLGKTGLFTEANMLEAAQEQVAQLVREDEDYVPF